ncbi:MAG: hypothetical protein CEN90_97 [Parcubacteria group bacterium Licking1014_17]|nr:MAG: hypothetical protein CEN90_97 [Parcubacteria group bacterium Licking1014_17]
MHIKNLFSRFLAVINCHWKQITTNMPFRMLVGKFGIRLAEIGRILQVRYANWNGEFRLKREMIPGCPYQCYFHVSERVTLCSILSFDGPQSQPDKRTPLVDALFDIKGVKRVWLSPYEVTVRITPVFSWEELSPSIEKVLLKHLATAA